MPLWFDIYSTLVLCLGGLTLTAIMSFQVSLSWYTAYKMLSSDTLSSCRVISLMFRSALQHLISPIRCITRQIRVQAEGEGGISQRACWQTTTFPRKFVSLTSCMPRARHSAGNRWFPECPRADFWGAASSPRGARRRGGRALSLWQT